MYKVFSPLSSSFPLSFSFLPFLRASRMWSRRNRSFLPLLDFPSYLSPLPPPPLFPPPPLPPTPRVTPLPSLARSFPQKTPPYTYMI